MDAKRVIKVIWQQLFLMSLVLLSGGSAREHPTLAVLRQAERAAAQGQRSAAESAYQQALSALPAPYPALRLAQLYRDWGRPQEARHALDLARQLGAPAALVNEEYLPVLIALQAWDEAQTLAQAQLQAQPTSHAAWDALTRALLAREACAEARQASEAWYALQPADPAAQRLWAYLHLTSDFGLAQALLCSQDAALCASLKSCAADEACALSLGTALINQGDWPLALCLLRPIVTAHPDYAPAQAWLGAALIQAQRYPDARQALEQALRLDAAQPLAWSLLGLLQLQEADYQGAETSLFQAHTLDPGNPAFCLAMARLYALQGAYEKVDLWAGAALDRAGEDAVVWQSVARFYLERGQRGAVLERALRGAHATAPQSSQTLLLHGWAALLREDLAQARSWLEQAIAQDPSSGEAWYLYGLVLEKTGADAQAAFTRARDAGYQW